MSTQTNNKPMQINQPNPQKDEKRDEKREENERRLVEQQLLEFDSHSFYDNLNAWTEKPCPKPEHQDVRVSLLRKKDALVQPLPIARHQMLELRRLSRGTLKLLRLLRSIDQKGIECPYVHTQNKKNIELAAKKCLELLEGASRYRSSRGFVNLIKRVFHGLFLSRAAKEIEYFKIRLESLLLFCRHQEFAREISSLSHAMSYQNLDTQPTPQKNQVAKKQPRTAFFSNGQ